MVIQIQFFRNVWVSKDSDIWFIPEPLYQDNTYSCNPYKKDISYIYLGSITITFVRMNNS